MTLTGVANQMTFPLRAEYLANEKYGINISNFSTTHSVQLPHAKFNSLGKVVLQAVDHANEDHGKFIFVA
jgi:hypothetical protein